MLSKLLSWGQPRLDFHADALREWSRLDEALELALQGVRLSEQTETIVALYLGYTLLMRIYLARKEMDAARLAFRKAEEALQKTYSPYRRDAYLIVHWMQFWVASGEQERTRNWLQEIEQPGSVDTAVHAPLAHERQEVARVRICSPGRCLPKRLHSWNLCWAGPSSRSAGAM